MTSVMKTASTLPAPLSAASTPSCSPSRQVRLIDATSEGGNRADQDNANDANTDLTIDFGFVGAKASTFSSNRQAINGLNGQNGPTQNGDTDTFNNLVEYALCQNPASGVQPSPAFCARLNAGTNPADGKVEAFYTRRAGGGQSDITYTLEVLNELSQSPTGWRASTLTPTITANGDGTERVYYPSLEQDPAFAVPITGSSVSR